MSRPSPQAPVPGAPTRTGILLAALALGALTGCTTATTDQRAGLTLPADWNAPPYAGVDANGLLPDDVLAPRMADVSFPTQWDILRP